MGFGPFALSTFTSMKGAIYHKSGKPDNSQIGKVNISNLRTK